MRIGHINPCKAKTTNLYYKVQMVNLKKITRIQGYPQMIRL